MLKTPTPAIVEVLRPHIHAMDLARRKIRRAPTKKHWSAMIANPNSISCETARYRTYLGAPKQKERPCSSSEIPNAGRRNYLHFSLSRLMQNITMILLQTPIQAHPTGANATTIQMQISLTNTRNAKLTRLYSNRNQTTFPDRSPQNAHGSATSKIVTTYSECRASKVST